LRENTEIVEQILNKVKCDIENGNRGKHLHYHISFDTPNLILGNIKKNSR
jgi:hypothetical protein